MKYSNRAFVILIFICITNYALFSQIVSVKDKNTLEPLELVSVFNVNPNRSLISNQNGIVDISRLDTSKTIVFQLVGYKRSEFSFDEIKRNNFIVLMEPSIISIENIIVSANRWDDVKTEIPNTVQIISPSEVNLQNPQTTADMLGTSANVFIQKSQLGGGSPMIRGFATNRLLISVDGVRMNTAIFRSGNLQNVISLDANTLENTTIIFGPGSVIYGSDAIAGVMSFNTLKPRYSFANKFSFNGSAMSRYSSANNEKTGHIHLNLANDNLGFLTSITYSDYDNLVMGSKGPTEYLRSSYQTRINGRDTVITNPNPKEQIESGYNQLNLMQKIVYSPMNDWEFEYGFHYSKTSDYSRYDRLLRPRGNTLRSAEWYYGPQIWIMNNFNITNYSSNSIFDFSRLIFAYQFFNESRHDRNLNSPNKTNTFEKVDAYSFNLDFSKQFSSSEINYGFEAVFNKVGSEGNNENIQTGLISPAASRYPNGSIWNSFGTYFAYKNKLNKNLILHSGLRFNYVYLEANFDTTFYPFPFTYAEQKSSSITGNLGLNWKPENQWQINLHLSSGFRAPNIDDIGKVFDSEPGSVVIPNPKLNSEYAYSAEVSLIKNFDDIVEVNLTGYYTYLDNALVRRNFTLNGKDSIFYNGELSQVQAIQNAAYARIWGIEFFTNVKIDKYFGLFTNLVYQNGEEEIDNGDLTPLRHAAPLFGKTELSFKKENLQAIFYVTFNGEISFKDLSPTEYEKDYLYAKDENGNIYSPAWFTLNLKINYEPFKNMFLSFGLENITDQRYRPYSSGISAAGRNFIIALKTKF